MSFKNLSIGLATAIAGLTGIAPAASADQLSDITQRKELRCGTFADVPPFAAPDAKTREMVGFDVDLCKGYVTLAPERDLSSLRETIAMQQRVGIIRRLC